MNNGFGFQLAQQLEEAFNQGDINRYNISNETVKKNGK